MRSVLVEDVEGGGFFFFDVRYSSSRPMSWLCVSHKILHTIIQESVCVKN